MVVVILRFHSTLYYIYGCESCFFRKTQKLEDNNTKSDAVTHASVRPTHAPSWEEMVTLGVDAKTAEDESNQICLYMIYFLIEIKLILLEIYFCF